MSVQTQEQVAYGFSAPTFGVFSAPIISQRDPTVRDRAELGTVWVNKVTQAYYILTSVAANVSTWVTAGSATGIFASLEATAGNITADVGDIVATLGNVIVSAGNIVATVGDVNAGGDINAAGSLTAGVDVNVTGNVIGGGDLQITGAATIVNGNLNLTNGTIAVLAGDIGVQLGNIVVDAGSLSAPTIYADGDLGNGGAGTTGFTNITNVVQGAGALTILSTTGNPGTNAEFIKIYVGAATAYLPYWTNIAP